MAVRRQARNMTEGKYVNCSVKYVEWEGEIGGDRWVEGVDVTITASWAAILRPDGTTKRFLQKTNNTLQIYPNMFRLDAETERHKYRAKNSQAADNPAHLGIDIQRPKDSNIGKMVAWDRQYYGRQELRDKRGWSHSQIQQLQCVHDALDTDNPHRPPFQKRLSTGSPLYLQTRVDKIESSPDWIPESPHVLSWISVQAATCCSRTE